MMRGGRKMKDLPVTPTSQVSQEMADRILKGLAAGLSVQTDIRISLLSPSGSERTLWPKQKD